MACVDCVHKMAPSGAVRLQLGYNVVQQSIHSALNYVYDIFWQHIFVDKLSTLESKLD